MPITLTVPEGLLTPEAESRAFAELSHALLKINQLDGNPFMEPNVVGTLNVLPKGHVFAGGKPAAAAFVELKLPAVALTTPEAQRAFSEAATAILERAAEGRLSRDRIWTNVVYAADGSWGIGGHAYSNAELVGAIQRAAAW